MNFSQMMIEIESGKLATRPSWDSGVSITMAEADFVIFVDEEDPDNIDGQSVYELDLDDFYATDWVIF